MIQNDSNSTFPAIIMSVEHPTEEDDIVMSEDAFDESTLEKSSIPESFFYEASDLTRQLGFGEIPRSYYALNHAFGFDVKKRNNIHFIEEGVLLTVAGNTVQFIDTVTWRKTYIFGLDGGGIGSIAVHPSKEYFAVAEKGNKPNIYIYEYSSRNVYRILRKGTERAYSSVCFSHDGEKMASVGSKPDFLLTVWNWKEEQIILRCKAFGQEVFNVKFAHDNDGFLTTSGTGHIRFWKMADTFTGLKLQGSIGKFGKIELSDIESFCVLPDGKVLSSTERGSLLLWDGNLIKCEIMCPNRQLPHDGAVNVVLYEEEDETILTAGSDGFLKWWNFDDIDSADAMEDDTIAEITPKFEFQIGKELNTPVNILSVVRGNKNYLIQDSNGCLHQFDMLTAFSKEVRRFHAGGILGVCTSPTEYFAATVGEDCSVKCWDFVSSTLLFSSHFDSPACCVTWCPVFKKSPSNKDSSDSDTTDDLQQSIAVGFENGVVRILHRGKSKWGLAHVFKPHSSSVSAVSFSVNGIFFATGSKDKTIFLFRTPTSADLMFPPIGFLKVSDSVTSLSWRNDSSALLYTCCDGEIGEIEVPLDLSRENQDTYEIQLPIRKYPFCRKKLLSLEELNNIEDEFSGSEFIDIPSKAYTDVDADSFSALSAVYDKTDKRNFLVSLGGCHAGKLYSCSWKKIGPHDSIEEIIKVYPIDSFPCQKSSSADPLAVKYTETVYLAYSHSSRFILSGNENGSIYVRSSSSPFAYLNIELHDSIYGCVNQVCMSFDDKYLLSGGGDGQLFVCRMDEEEILNAADILVDAFSKKESDIRASTDVEYSKATALHTKNEALQNSDNANQLNIISESPSFVATKFYINLCSQVEHVFHTTSFINEIDEGIILAVENSNKDHESRKFLSSMIVPSNVDVTADGREVINTKDTIDITDANAYTIQDAKLKMEEDVRKDIAEKKKNYTRSIISDMRDEFAALYEANKNEIPSKKLDMDEFNIDPNCVEDLKDEGDQACDEVRKEMAYPLEMSELKLKKLKQKYIDNVAIELITICGFKNNAKVQSFRTTYLSEPLQESLKNIHSELEQKFMNINTCQQNKGLVRKHSVLDITQGSVDPSEVLQQIKRTHSAYKSNLIACLPKPSDASQDEQGLSSGGEVPSLNGTSATIKSSGKRQTGHGFEVRKQMRLERKKRLEDLLKQKPGEDMDDIRDVAAISFSETNLGDYKLKSSDDFVVPEEERVNATKKKKQIMLLEEEIYLLKMKFNEQILDLRNKKKENIEEIRSAKTRINSINIELQQNDKNEVEKLRKTSINLFHEINSHTNDNFKMLDIDWQPNFDSTEWPEYRETVCEQEIELFHQGKVELHSSMPSNTSNDQWSNNKEISNSNVLCKQNHFKGFNQVLKERKRGIPLIDQAENTKTTDNPSDVEVSFNVINICRIIEEKASLISMIDGIIANFDERVMTLRHQKIGYEVVLKRYEMNLMILSQELVLLENFQTKDSLLATKLDKFRTEKASIVAEITEYSDKIASKKEEINIWQQKEKKAMSEFHGLVSDTHTSYNSLLKIFKRRIKRKKRANNGGNEDSKNEEEDDDDNEDEDDDDDDDSLDSDEEDENDDDDDEEDVCPTGCDTMVYEKVLALREKRLDQEEMTTDLIKIMEELKRYEERLLQKQRQIDKELDQTELEIQSFQTDKQRCFNQLDVIVPLSKKQIAYLVESPEESQPTDTPRSNLILPSTISNGLVFSTEGLCILKNRINELILENRCLREKFKDLHRHQSRLQRDKKLKEEQILINKSRCEDLQLLKFGQLIDLNVLDRAIGSKHLIDLKDKIRLEEAKNQSVIHKIKNQHQQLKYELMKETEENTQLLEAIAKASERQFELEKTLNKVNVFDSLVDDTPKVKKEIAERKKFIQLVKLQTREIDALKQEIGMLRGKSSQLYAPPPPSAPASVHLNPSRLSNSSDTKDLTDAINSRCFESPHS